jgi:hypothetical protein
MRSPASSAFGVLAVLAISLAGCAGDDPRFPPTQVTDSAGGVGGEAPGVHVTATVEGGGDELRIHAEARNQGSRDWQVPRECAGGDPGPAEPWSVAARGRQDWDPSLPIYPQGDCSSVLLGLFPPGAVVTGDYTWDGSYPFEDGRAHASPGFYDLEVVLEVYEPGTNTPHPVVVRLPVQVLS